MSRKVLLQLVLPLIGLSVLFWLLAFAPGDKHHQPALLEMSVILRDGDGNVSAMRKGMEQAAKDLNVELRFLTPAEDNSAVEQVQLLEHEVSGAAPAILLIPADREALGEAAVSVSAALCEAGLPHQAAWLDRETVGSRCLYQYGSSGPWRGAWESGAERCALRRHGAAAGQPARGQRRAGAYGSG